MFNVDEAPAEIFEWLEKHDFQDLPEKNKTLLMNYFTAEEYEDMRAATRALQLDAGSRKVSSERKSSVMARFDDHYTVRTVRTSAHLIWKIAAVLFPMLLIAVTYWFSKGQDQQRATLVVHDTVYLHKTGEQTTVYDTVFIEKTLQNAGVKTHYKPVNHSAVEFVSKDSKNDLGVVPFTQQEEVQNTIRTYSVRDDSLFNLFPSVSL